MVLRDVKCRGVSLHRISLAQNKVQWRVRLNGNEPSDFINIGKFILQLSFYELLK
jgi:hypothetical protein